MTVGESESGNYKPKGGKLCRKCFIPGLLTLRFKDNALGVGFSDLGLRFDVADQGSAGIGLRRGMTSI